MNAATIHPIRKFQVTLGGHTVEMSDAQLVSLRAEIDNMLCFRSFSIRKIIMQVVATSYGIDLSDMVSGKRPDRIAWPRQVAMYFFREFTKDSLMEIGRQFGGRDHGTVLHASRRVQGLIDTETETAEKIQRMREAISKACVNAKGKE